MGPISTKIFHHLTDIRIVNVQTSVIMAERIVRGMRLANVLLGDQEIAPVFATAAAQVWARLRVLPKQGKILTATAWDFGSVPDPDSKDPYVFGPPESGSFHQQAKK
jgi:hypothetical protein